MAKKKTICFDFDGVLHSYTSPWAGHTVIKDGPVPGAQDTCERLLLAGWKVVVFSTRSKDEAGREAMRLWLREYEFPGGMQIASEKLPAEVYVDDRGFSFNGNFDQLLLFLAGDTRPWNKKGEV